MNFLNISSKILISVCKCVYRFGVMDSKNGLICMLLFPGLYSDEKAAIYYILKREVRDARWLCTNGYPFEIFVDFSRQPKYINLLATFHGS
jgi:hypothetical protein